MSKRTPSLLDIVTAWLAGPGSGLCHTGHAPSPSRLAKRCLAPLCQAVVSPTPTATYAQRVAAVLDAAADALDTDLRAADAEARTALAGLDPQLRQWITADDVQSRVAILLRTAHQASWQAGHASKTQWREGPLTDALQLLAMTRRAKGWTQDARALDPEDFTSHWSQTVADEIARRPPDQSVDAGLGDLETPHLATDPEPLREWRLATDRSFHNRICLYWDGKHLPDVDTVPSTRLADEAAPGEALVTESITRTVAPYGLRDPAHQRLASVLADAVGAAAAGGRPIDGAPLAQVWVQAVNPGAHQTGVLRHVGIHLAKRKVPIEGLDDVRYGQCVARRVWVRMHAWELCERTIPARQLLVALNSALDASRNAEGVQRSLPTPLAEPHRIDATITLIHAIREETAATDAAAIVEEYRRRYPASPRAILTPRQVERLLRTQETS